MLFRYFRRRRRERLRRLPVVDTWRRIAEREVPYFRHLPLSDQDECLRHTRVFLAEKRFEGARGLVVTEEMRIVVAVQACQLLLHRDTDYYPGLGSIVLYPQTFTTPVRRALGSDVAIADEEERSGESWEFGTVVLAWNEVRESLRYPDDGYNVVLHEFAHQLDQENGSEDGVPLLADDAAYGRWASVFTYEYEMLCRAAEKEEDPDTLLDPYGAESPAEFFAVATETFFEMPREMKITHPELYAELHQYFRQDPAAFAPVFSE